MNTNPLILSVIISLALPSVAGAALVAHWEAEGSGVNTVAPGTHDLASTGGNTGFESGYGGGQAFSFGSPNGYRATDHHPSLSLTDQTDFTIALWANFDSIITFSPIWQPNTFISKTDSNAGRHYAFYYANSRPYFSFTSGGTEYQIGAPNAHAVGTDEWHHFAVTRSNGDFTFYADGTELGTVQNSQEIDDLIHPLSIGRGGHDPANAYFYGGLDDIRFYSGSTLSTGEIQALAGIPEPSRGALLALGLIGVGLRRRRK